MLMPAENPLTVTALGMSTVDHTPHASVANVMTGLVSGEMGELHTSISVTTSETVAFAVLM
jgi:hypothetical protein